jgi:hypothetical protein
LNVIKSHCNGWGILAEEDFDSDRAACGGTGNDGYWVVAHPPEMVAWSGDP